MCIYVYIHMHIGLKESSLYHTYPNNMDDRNQREWMNTYIHSWTDENICQGVCDILILPVHYATLSAYLGGFLSASTMQPFIPKIGTQLLSSL